MRSAHLTPESNRSVSSCAHHEWCRSGARGRHKHASAISSYEKNSGWQRTTQSSERRVSNQPMTSQSPYTAARMLDGIARGRRVATIHFEGNGRCLAKRLKGRRIRHRRAPPRHETHVCVRLARADELRHLIELREVVARRRAALAPGRQSGRRRDHRWERTLLVYVPWLSLQTTQV